MNNIPQQPLSTSDERLMAAVSHLFGLLVALIIWVTNKDRSRYVRFQATQSMAFDLVVMVVTFILVGCLMVGMMAVMALGTGGMIFSVQPDGSPPDGPFALFILLMTGVPFLIPCIMVPYAMFLWVCRIVATIQTFQGKDFRYPWLGGQVERFLNQP